MVKVNLLPTKRRKKRPKPVTVSVAVMAITIAVTGVIMAYFFFVFSSELAAKRAEFASTEKKLAELKEKIAAVENLEKLNMDIQQKKDTIEQLRRYQSVPVRLLDEISKLLPKGVWLQTMAVSGESIDLEGYAFTNTQIVSYVDRLKHSPLFFDVYLQESKGTVIDNIPLYNFRLIFKIKT